MAGTQLLEFDPERSGVSAVVCGWIDSPGTPSMPEDCPKQTEHAVLRVARVIAKNEVLFNDNDLRICLPRESDGAVEALPL